MHTPLSSATAPPPRTSPLHYLKQATAGLLGRESPAYLDLYHRVVRRPRFPSVADLVHRYAAAHRDRTVTFAQIGANEGATEDVLYYPIHRYGWRGVLVEPQDAEFARLRENYRANPRVAYEHAAVIAPGAEAPELHYVVPEPGLPAWVSKLSSFDAAITRQVLSAYPSARLAKRGVRGTTLADLLARHDLERVEVLVTDTEGYDYEILKQIDWSGMRPDLIIYEHRHLSERDAQSLGVTLAAQGYASFSGELDTAAVRDPGVLAIYGDRMT